MRPSRIVSFILGFFLLTGATSERILIDGQTVPTQESEYATVQSATVIYRLRKSELSTKQQRALDSAFGHFRGLVPRSAIAYAWLASKERHSTSQESTRVYRDEIWHIPDGSFVIEGIALQSFSEEYFLIMSKGHILFQIARLSVGDGDIKALENEGKHVSIVVRPGGVKGAWSFAPEARSRQPASQ